MQKCITFTTEMNTKEAFIQLIQNKDLCYRIGLKEDYRRYLKRRAVTIGNVSDKTMRKHLAKAGFIFRATEIWISPYTNQ